MKKALLLFCCAVSLAVGAGEPVKEMFSLSFSQGLVADSAMGDAKPTKAKNVSLVPGYVGDGCRVPRDGQLVFDAKNLPKGRGTLCVWVNLAWEPMLAGGPADGHGVFASSAASNGPVCALLGGKNLMTPPKAGSDHLRRVKLDVFKDTWRFLSFTWDKRERNVYVDGEPVVASDILHLGDEAASALSLGAVSGVPLSLDGVIDEVKVYDRALTADEVAALYSSCQPVVPLLRDYATMVGADRKIRLLWRNGSPKEIRAPLEVGFEAEDGEALGRIPVALALPAGVSQEASFTFSPAKPGWVYMTVAKDGKVFKRFKIMVLSDKPIAAAMPLSKTGETKETLLEEIDCSSPAKPPKYRDDGHCVVVDGPFGPYRAAYGRSPACGFAYNMAVKHPKQPHWLEIDYPEDVARTFFVTVFHERDKVVHHTSMDTIGVISGVNHPLSHKMETRRLLFWPDTDMLLVGAYLYGAHPQQGPALAKIRLYEIEGELPRLQVNPPRDALARELGVWEEDPMMFEYDWFSTLRAATKQYSLEFWEEKWGRVVRYLHYSGQNAWNVLAFDYSGSSSCTLGLPWSNYRMPGWLDVGAVMMERDGIDFFLEMHDMEGLDYVVGKENLCGTFAEAEKKGVEALECFPKDFSPTAKPRRLDPLQPKVQDAYIQIIRAYCAQYGSYQRFRGLTIVGGRNLFYESLSEGYGDYDVKTFEKDTGVAVPVAAAKRYDWIMANCKEKWIQWRAAGLREFHQRLVDAVREGDPTRKIMVVKYQTQAEIDCANSWPASDSDLKACWAGQGLDPKATAAIDGFVLMPTLDPYMDPVWQWKPERPGNRFYSFNPELSDLFADVGDNKGVVIMKRDNLEYHHGMTVHSDKYWEGKRPEEVHVPKPMECYSTALPANRYALEYLARCLADFNPACLIQGWWGSPDSGSIGVFLPFYRAFRAVPMLDFRQVPGVPGDPVAVKTASQRGGGAASWLGLGGRGYLLLVNRESYPVELALKIGQDALHDLVEGCDVALDQGVLRLTVKPYQVLCFRCDGDFAVSDVTMTPPAAVVADAKKSLEDYLAKLARAKADGVAIPGADVVRAKAEAQLKGGEYSAFHYLMQSSPAKNVLTYEMKGKK